MMTRGEIAAELRRSADGADRYAERLQAFLDRCQFRPECVYPGAYAGDPWFDGVAGEVGAWRRHAEGLRALAEEIAPLA